MSSTKQTCPCGSSEHTALITILDIRAMGDTCIWLQCSGCDSIYTVMDRTKEIYTEADHYTDTREIRQHLNLWISDSRHTERELRWTQRHFD